MNWIGIKNNISDEYIKEIEKELNIKLPYDYCKAIVECNGGALRNAYYHSNELGDISYSRNVNLNKEVRANAVSLFSIINEKEKRLFPFGSVGNGDYFCFDLFDNNKVVLYIHEKNEVHYLCDSYSKLVAGIHSD